MFALRDASTLEFLQKHAKEGSLGQYIVPIGQALEFLPVVTLIACQWRMLSQARTSTDTALQALLPQDSQHTAAYRLCLQSGETVAVVQRQQADAAWKMVLLDAAIS
jgi:hypothetical protein